MKLLREYIREVVYHGRCGPYDAPKFADWRPAFFAHDKEKAKWFSLEGCNEKSWVYECELSYSRPASFDDLMSVMATLGTTQDDIKQNARGVGGQGEYDTSGLYVKDVLHELEDRGFDAWEGEDEFLGGEWINVVVVWHPRQISVLSTERVRA